MGTPADIILLLPNSYFLSQYNFRTSVDPSTNLLVTVLPVTFPSHWNVLSDPLLSSCMSLRSALVLFRLGLPATEVNLAYLYKALAFAHLYVPQSCYHKSSCLSTSGHMTLTSAILTFAPLHFRSIIELLVENPLFTNSPKANTSLRLSVSLLTWLRLNQAHLQDIVRNLKTITCYFLYLMIGLQSHFEFATESNCRHSSTLFQF